MWPVKVPSASDSNHGEDATTSAITPHIQNPKRWGAGAGWRDHSAAKAALNRIALTAMARCSALSPWAITGRRP